MFSWSSGHLRQSEKRIHTNAHNTLAPDCDVRQLEPVAEAEPQLHWNERARGAPVEPQKASHLVSRHGLLA